MRFSIIATACGLMLALTGLRLVGAQEAVPDTVIVQEGAEARVVQPKRQAPPPGVARVRDRIAQIRGLQQPAPRIVYVYPDGRPVPAEALGRVAPASAQAPEAQTPAPAAPTREPQVLDRQAMSDLMRQMDRRFERLGDRLDDMEALYYDALRRSGQVDGGTTIILEDGRRAVVPDEQPAPASELDGDEALQPRDQSFERLTPPRLRPGVDRQPRADLPPRVQEVERALLDAGLFRTIEIVFEFDRSDILGGSERTLEAIGTVLERNPDLRVEIGGHTDSIGSEEYNQGLSERRAASVRDYLVENYGLDEDRLIAVGYGETRPIFGNENPTGRTLNRRVEFEVLDEGE